MFQLRDDYSAKLKRIKKIFSWKTTKNESHKINMKNDLPEKFEKNTIYMIRYFPGYGGVSEFPCVNLYIPFIENDTYKYFIHSFPEMNPNHYVFFMSKFVEDDLKYLDENGILNECMYNGNKYIIREIRSLDGFDKISIPIVLDINLKKYNKNDKYDIGSMKHIVFENPSDINDHSSMDECDERTVLLGTITV
jgi:hypothetical protein